MVTRAFDPNTKITSTAMSEMSNDESEHQFVYKMNSVFSNNSVSQFGQSSRKMNRLPNMGNIDSVATVDSIGVKMPQYRRHNKPSSSSSQQHQPPPVPPNSNTKGHLDGSELKNKLAVIQKQDIKGDGKMNKRGREKKYMLGDSRSASSNNRGSNNKYPDDLL